MRPASARISSRNCVPPVSSRDAASPNRSARSRGVGTKSKTRTICHAPHGSEGRGGFVDAPVAVQRSSDGFEVAKVRALARGAWRGGVRAGQHRAGALHSRAMQPLGAQQARRSRKTVEEIAAEQGVGALEDLDEVAALWPADDDPDEFDAFVASERAARRQAPPRPAP